MGVKEDPVDRILARTLTSYPHYVVFQPYQRKAEIEELRRWCTENVGHEGNLIFEVQGDWANLSDLFFFREETKAALFKLWWSN